MRRLSSGQKWEEYQRKRQEAESWDREAQRVAATQAIRDQVESPCFPPPPTRALSCRPQQQQQNHHDPRKSTTRYTYATDEVPELETQTQDEKTPPPQYRPSHGSPNPPASLSTGGTSSTTMDTNSFGKIRQLQSEVLHKESEIRRLESVIEAERDGRRRLQAERHEAIDAQLMRANYEDEASLRGLKANVANVELLLAGSRRREKELEGELDAARVEIGGLKRRLFEERSLYESDGREREMRERERERGMRGERCPARDGVEVVKGEMQGERYCPWRLIWEDHPSDMVLTDAPSRSRRQRRSTSGRAFVSVPKDGSRRNVWVFT